MLFRKVKRKIYKAFHPAMGEVWMLHRVIPEEQRSVNKKQRDLEVTPEYLEKKILEYQKKGYEFVSIEEVTDCLQNSKFKIQNSKFVAITLDDGYADNFQYAYPIFKKLNIPFAVYITTGFIDGTAPMWWYEERPQMMDWEQVQQLSQDSLCTIGAHTVTHSRLGQVELNQAQCEIEESKRIIEEKLHINIEHFSYPHGDYTPMVCQVVQNGDFKSAVLVWGGKVRTGQSCYEIPRVPIVM